MFVPMLAKGDPRGGERKDVFSGKKTQFPAGRGVRGLFIGPKGRDHLPIKNPARSRIGKKKSPTQKGGMPSLPERRKNSDIRPEKDSHCQMCRGGGKNLSLIQDERGGRTSAIKRRGNREAVDEEKGVHLVTPFWSGSNLKRETKKDVKNAKESL